MANSIRHGNLVVTLPDGWSDASQIVALGPDEGGFRPSLVVSLEPAQGAETAKALADRSLTALKKALRELDKIAEKPATLGGVAGVLREYTCQSAQGRMAQLQFYSVKNGQARTYTYSTTAEKLAAARPIAEKLFASVVTGAK